MLSFLQITLGISNISSSLTSERAKVLYVEGRQFPVDVMYTREPQSDYLDAALTTVIQIHLEEADGDILVFLTGKLSIHYFNSS